MRRGIAKQLTCPACGDVIASATYKRWPCNLVLVSTEGHLIQSVGAAVEIRRTEQQLTAASPTHQVAALDRLDFLRHHLEELIYDLRCRRGHSVLRTAAQIRRAMLCNHGSWATLS